MKTVYIDMDGVLCDYVTRKEEMLSAHPNKPYPQSEYGFFSGLDPMDGAIAAAQSLLEHDSIEPYILTAPSVHNPLCYTEKRVWVEKYLGIEYVNRLIISPNKSLLIGDYLIDDHDEGRGQENFRGELIHFGSEVYPDWESVLNYLT